MESVKERVERGAEWMDNTFQGWRSIDPEEIELAVCSLDPRSVFTGVQVTVSHGPEEQAWAEAHGFEASEPDEWDSLTEAWRAVLG